MQRENELIIIHWGTKYHLKGWSKCSHVLNTLSNYICCENMTFMPSLFRSYGLKTKEKFFAFPVYRIGSMRQKIKDALLLNEKWGLTKRSFTRSESNKGIWITTSSSSSSTSQCYKRNVFKKIKIRLNFLTMFWLNL